MDELLHVETEQDGPRSVVTASGEIDVSNTRELLTAIDAVSHDGVSELVLDLEQVSFIDSTGIRCLLDTELRCRERSIKLRIHPSHAVRRLAELTGVTERLSLD